MTYATITNTLTNQVREYLTNLGFTETFIGTFVYKQKDFDSNWVVTLYRDKAIVSLQDSYLNHSDESINCEFSDKLTNAQNIQKLQLCFNDLWDNVI